MQLYNSARIAWFKYTKYEIAFFNNSEYIKPSSKEASIYNINLYENQKDSFRYSTDR